MSRDKVALENKFRKMVYTHIVEYPGVSFSKLKKIYDLNESTLRYHLGYLKRAERVISRLENGKLHYYPYNSVALNSKPSDTTLKPHELTPQEEHILNTIKHYPGINQTELMAKTSYQRHILTYYISKLVERGVVRRSNHEKNVCYEYITNELLQYEMLKVLTIKLLNNEIDEQTFLKLRRKIK